MAVNFSKTFSSAFRYAFDFNRLLPFFIINLVMVAFIIFFIDSIIDFLPAIISSNWAGVSIANLIYTALAFVIIILITVLLRIYFQAAIADNARFYWQDKRKDLTKSFPTGSKYLTVLFALILAMIITVLVSGFLGLIHIIGPFLSIIVSIILSLIFMFLIQIVVISNKGALDAIKEGYGLFMKNKFDVFIFWLVLNILSIVILIVAVFPILIAFISIAAPLLDSLIAQPGSVDGAKLIADAIPLVKANLLNLGIASILSALIFSYLTVFQESAKTFFYMQKKRK